MSTLLKVENLWASAQGKDILKGVNLKIEAGEIQAFLGPNASGKSTLAQVILGNPKYQVKKGKISFQGKDITRLSPEKRAKLGIALSWQAPPSIRGVGLSQLLKKISAKKDFKLKEAKDLLEREVNLDLSGGEKKISELLQVLSLKPKLIIFDEIDSGLDIKRLEKVAKTIKGEIAGKKVSLLLITHWGEILNFLKPDFTNVMLGGKIICCEKNLKEVLNTIKKYGYEKCKKCPLFTDKQ
jgi:Fe-S cluster assembly ATP-binding protein